MAECPSGADVWGGAEDMLCLHITAAPKRKHIPMQPCMQRERRTSCIKSAAAVVARKAMSLSSIP